VTDAAGRKTGTLSGATALDAEAAATEEIRGSQYEFVEAWRDPTCTERAPTPGTGVNHVFISGSEGATFTIEVTNPAGGATDVTVHTYDEAGNPSIEPHHGDGDIAIEVAPQGGGNVPAATDKMPDAKPPKATVPKSKARDGSTFPAGTAGGSDPNAGNGGAAPSGGVSVTPGISASGVTPSVTPTPTLTATPTVASQALDISSFVLQELPFPNCDASISWILQGDPAGSVTLRRVTVALAAVVVFSGPATGATAYVDALDPWDAARQLYGYQLTTSDGHASPLRTLTPCPPEPATITLIAPILPNCNGVTQTALTVSLKDPAGHAVVDGWPVYFNVLSNGSVNPQTAYTAAGLASTTLTPGTSSPISVQVGSGGIAVPFDIGCGLIPPAVPPPCTISSFTAVQNYLNPTTSVHLDWSLSNCGAATELRISASLAGLRYAMAYAWGSQSGVHGYSFQATPGAALACADIFCSYQPDCCGSGYGISEYNGACSKDRYYTLEVWKGGSREASVAAANNCP
jgi:hypothetical protein